jgi:hypothetical protein
MGPNKEVFENRFTPIFFLSPDKKICVNAAVKTDNGPPQIFCDV